MGAAMTDKPDNAEALIREAIQDDEFDKLLDAHAQNVAAGSITAATEAREALRAMLAAAPEVK